MNQQPSRSDGQACGEKIADVAEETIEIKKVLF
jgi:hypothetical protein